AVVVTPPRAQEPQPLHEGFYLVVRPHPRGPSLEPEEHVFRSVARSVVPFDVAVDRVALGPVPLHGDAREAMMEDEPLGETDPRSLELGRAVAPLTEEDEASIADAIEQGAEVAVGLDGDRVRTE